MVLVEFSPSQHTHGGSEPLLHRIQCPLVLFKCSCAHPPQAREHKEDSWCHTLTSMCMHKGAHIPCYLHVCLKQPVKQQRLEIHRGWWSACVASQSPGQVCFIHCINQECWRVPIMPTLGKEKQEDHPWQPSKFWAVSGPFPRKTKTTKTSCNASLIRSVALHTVVGYLRYIDGSLTNCWGKTSFSISGTQETMRVDQCLVPHLKHAQFTETKVITERWKIIFVQYSFLLLFCFKTAFYISWDRAVKLRN